MSIFGGGIIVSRKGTIGAETLISIFANLKLENILSILRSIKLKKKKNDMQTICFEE